MSDRDGPSGVLSKVELAQRLARVKKGVDRHSAHIERLADSLDRDLENKRERLGIVETGNQKLWYAYNAGKRILAVTLRGAHLRSSCKPWYDRAQNIRRRPDSRPVIH